MTDNLKTPYLTVQEAGEYVRLAKRTLDNMRWIGHGPEYRKHGGRIYFHVNDLRQWSLDTRFKSTSKY